ncbi:hypothetical protein EBU24_03570 [bacterium]|nr:hypothetical protein [bacterium]
MSNLYHKEDKLLITFDVDQQPKLAINKFYCCAPTEWRIIRQPIDQNWKPADGADIDLIPGNSYFVNNPINNAATPNCDQFSFVGFSGPVEKQQQANDAIASKTLIRIPREIKHGSITNTFPDGKDGEYWYIWPNDNLNTKMYLNLEFVDAPCFPADRSPTPTTVNGAIITKTCIRVSPDYIIKNNKLEPNDEATYVFTVEKKITNGGSIAENSDSNCAGDDGLECVFIKSKIKDYIIRRYPEQFLNGNSIAPAKCCAEEKIAGVVNDGNTINNTGYIKCPADVVGSEGSIGSSGNTPSSSGNIRQKSLWYDNLVLEVKVDNVWLPVQGSAGFTRTTGKPDWFVDYDNLCWSGGVSPSIHSFSIGSGPGTIPPSGSSYCFDSAAFLEDDSLPGGSYTMVGSETDFLSDPPPCLEDSL